MNSQTENRVANYDRTYAYFYLMRDDGPTIASLAPEHARYWLELQLDGYSGGPFDDRSGGLILFECDTQQLAESLAAGDPFRKADVIDHHWLKRWAVQEA